MQCKASLFSLGARFCPKHILAGKLSKEFAHWSPSAARGRHTVCACAPAWETDDEPSNKWIFQSSLYRRCFPRAI